MIFFVQYNSDEIKEQLHIFLIFLILFFITQRFFFFTEVININHKLDFVFFETPFLTYFFCLILPNNTPQCMKILRTKSLCNLLFNNLIEKMSLFLSYTFKCLLKTLPQFCYFRLGSQTFLRELHPELHFDYFLTKQFALKQHFLEQKYLFHLPKS